MEADGYCPGVGRAGSGKTRTLIYRVAHLLENGARPEEILLVTFTNKAASEMRNRVELLLRSSPGAFGAGPFTISATAFYAYRPNTSAWATTSDPGRGGQPGPRQTLHPGHRTKGRRPQRPAFPQTGHRAFGVEFFCECQKEHSERRDENYVYLAPFIRDFERIKVLYDEKKKKTNNLDYDDLLTRWIELLKSSDAVRERFTRQFRWCLVDEYQDTNLLQQRSLQILSSHHKNLLWWEMTRSRFTPSVPPRSKISSIFPNINPNARIFKLETNYRSTRQILELANHSIRHNTHQFSKTLKSVRADGALPQFAKVPMRGRRRVCRPENTGHDGGRFWALADRGALSRALSGGRA